MASFVKTGGNILIRFVGNLMGVCFFVFLLMGIGLWVASVVYPHNQFLVSCSFVFLSMMFGYLIIRAELQGNDGIDSFGVALMSSWVYGAIATAMIFLMLSVSERFLIINLLVFIVITTILAVRVQRDRSRYYLQSWDESGRSIAVDDSGEKIKIKRSVFLAQNTLNIYSLAGLFTGIIAYALFRFGVAY